jgi:hypothetical protein
MTTKQHTQFLISVFIIFFINIIFSIKYFSRYTEYATILILCMTIFYLFSIYNRKINNAKIHLKLVILFFICYVIGSLFVVSKIPMQSLNVDRWSVITSFWDNYFRGEYVYYARSHHNNYPGPMPFYFIIALPFYLIREFAYLPLIGIGLFIFTIFQTKGKPKITNFVLIFLFTSPIFLWETIYRSAIFLNATLILLYLLYLRKIDKKSTHWVIGIVGGLLLSTRNVFILPYLLAFGYYFKVQEISFKQIVKIGFIMILTFALTFIPFVWNHSSDFFKMNPFIIQSSFLIPRQYSLLFSLLALLGIIFVKNNRDIVFATNIVLFFTICIYAIYCIKTVGFESAYFGSKIDVSYFIFCLPFALYNLLEYEIK